MRHVDPASLKAAYPVLPKSKARLPRATIDFETRSAADLKRLGAWLYSKAPTTQILCLAYKLPGSKKTRLWHRAHPAIGIEESPPPQDLFDWIAAGGAIEAHNAEFEIAIWKHVAVPQHGWPEIHDDQWMCSAAKASAVALPRALGDAILALGLNEEKDTRGKGLLEKYSKPRRLSRAEIELFGDVIEWNEDVEGLKATWRYCKQDVRAEEGLSHAIPDLSPHEFKVWQLTCRMNARGVLIDIDLCKSALHLVGEAKKRLNSELESITGIKAGSQRQAVRAWLKKHEQVDLPDTRGKTLERFLTREKLTDRAARVITIAKEVNRTSANKFKRFLESADDDNRVRGMLVYCGAERTGRFSSRFVQLHNLPKGKFNLPLAKSEKYLAMDIACADVKSRDYSWCEAMYGDVMNLVVSCLRGVIIAPPGRELISADYASIEARCVLWEAGATTALEIFRKGGDIYCDMASAIYGYEITKETAKVITSLGHTQRDFGKVAILGLGYGMGFLKFLITLRNYNIQLSRADVRDMMSAKRLRIYEDTVRALLFPTRKHFTNWLGECDERKFKLADRRAKIARRQLADEGENAEDVLHELALCKYTVETYRTRYAEVPAMWRAQEKAAIEAVETGKTVRCGPVKWRVVGRYLKCRLPSGRCLHYAYPEIKFAKNAWGKVSPSLRFKGRGQTSQKWIRQATYGGKIVENITQAIARDILGYAEVKVDEDLFDFDLLLNIHDQLIAEVDKGCGSDDEFVATMTTLPRVYDGCPIAAEPERYERFRK